MNRMKFLVLFPLLAVPASALELNGSLTGTFGEMRANAAKAPVVPGAAINAEAQKEASYPKIISAKAVGSDVYPESLEKGALPTGLLFTFIERGGAIVVYYETAQSVLKFTFPQLAADLNAFNVLLNKAPVGKIVIDPNTFQYGGCGYYSRDCVVQFDRYELKRSLSKDEKPRVLVYLQLKNEAGK